MIWELVPRLDRKIARLQLEDSEGNLLSEWHMMPVMVGVAGTSFRLEPIGDRVFHCMRRGYDARLVVYIDGQALAFYRVGGYALNVGDTFTIEGMREPCKTCGRTCSCDGN